nr:tRNA (adenosine(37)-N6)-threonylcarbamoyltransferase complex dimerization subunit type 1 TsaB [uncultured Cohaesibacter sp.]
MSKEREICLALDTALEACSVGLAIHQNEDVKTLERSLSLGRGHAEYLMGELDTLLTEASLHYQDLTKIAVTVGPGSFTGLRVGLATARALGLALDIPVIGASTLFALALEAQAEGHQGSIGCFIDARRNQIYGQIFSITSDLSAPEPETEASAKAAELFANDCANYPDLALIGNGSPLVVASGEASSLDERPILPARFPKMGAFAKWALKQPAPLQPPAPLYLRAPDAKKQASKAIAHR